MVMEYSSRNLKTTLLLSTTIFVSQVVKFLRSLRGCVNSYIIYGHYVL